MTTLDARTVHSDLSPDASPSPLAAEPINSLTLDFLDWVVRRPRFYAEAMDAWRSSYPRFTIWEDAIADGLINLERGSEGKLSQSMVVLTPRGRSLMGGT